MRFLATFLLTLSTLVPSHAAGKGKELLRRLEDTSGGRLGVYAVNTDDGAVIGYREKERFAVCSSFKVILAAAILEQGNDSEGLLEKRLAFTKEDFVNYSPITEKHVADGMTISELCAAAIQYSDNTAANLLMKQIGGPEAVTAYARAIGNNEFRLDRWETELNTAIPGDPRDTATPESMALSLERLTVGDALSAPHRTQLVDWMKGNTTGAKRIRAAVPAGWEVGDKTGSGDYGSATDIAIVWPPGKKPIVIAIYHTQPKSDAEWNNGVIAEAARIALEAFGETPAEAPPSE